MTKTLEQQVITQITSSAKEKAVIAAIVKELTKKIKEELTKQNIPATVELVGSIEKDTYLRHNMDIDLFLVYPPSYKKEKMGKQAIAIGRALLADTEECYAEHPYIRGRYKTYKVELVPCYRIEDASEKVSAVDRTPLHTSYIKTHLKEEQKQEVRLFKQFLKGIECYGAEAEIEGFSGYLCELVILNYKSFKKSIQQGSTWKYGEHIALSKGPFPSFNTPLVVIDPVDYTRNVASALSLEKFDLFVTACKAYIKQPKITFFFPNEVTPWTMEKIRKMIRKQNCLYVGIQFLKPDIIDENLYPQIRKGTRSIQELGERHGFSILDTAYHVDTDQQQITIIIKTAKESLPETLVHRGPPTTLKENMREFKKKWDNDNRVQKGPYEKNGRFFVEIKREYTTFVDLLRANMPSLSLGKHIGEIMQSQYTILINNELITKHLQSFWTTYLDGKLPWER
ncbi:MAG: CCA tRNA nucleotidyltransferase [Candidatus Thermoplasmatota archaeon]|nr:CCA tRNA nucleotidyltransferase [Candidatus Thermoplasmatota archaeon]